MNHLPNCAADRLIVALDREIRGRGYGSISAMERALGQSGGWWKHRVDSSRLDLRQALSVLDYLGLDPIRFLRQHLGREERLELHRPPGPEPMIVERARRRLTEGEEGSGVGEIFLRSLDRQRYEEPEEVLGLLEASAKLVEPELVPLLLGVAGSTYRMLLRHDEGEHCLRAAIEIAAFLNLPVSEAENLQRLAYIYSNRLDNAAALYLSEQAALLHLRYGDRAGFGKALIGQGIWLSRLQQHRAAIEVMRTALEWLPETETRHRCTAHQVLGLKFRELGDLARASEQAALAWELAEGLESVSVVKILWLKAQVQVDLGLLAEAETELLRILEAFWPRHPLEAAITCCDLVCVLLRQDRGSDAFCAAKKMLALLEPLRNQPVIAEQIAVLLRQEEAGLTLALVEQVRSKIERERRENHNWVPLRA